MNYIDVTELYQLWIENPDLIIIDVRSLEEYKTAHVPFAKLVPIDTILAQPEHAIEEILELVGDQEKIYIICLSDRRSFTVCHTLAKHNIDTCFIKGGTQNWSAAGYSIVSGS
jgi:rhodanese-related sulfurtransferase